MSPPASSRSPSSPFFFFNDTATTEIYTLSLHDALPISAGRRQRGHAAGTSERLRPRSTGARRGDRTTRRAPVERGRSEEHTSELQSRQYLVCRLLLEKKKDVDLDYLIDLPADHDVIDSL